MTRLSLCNAVQQILVLLSFVLQVCGAAPNKPKEQMTEAPRSEQRETQMAEQ